MAIPVVTLFIGIVLIFRQMIHCAGDQITPKIPHALEH